jgi:hypothetical protein
VVGVVKWIVIGALVLGVIILVASSVRVLRRLPRLKRAMDKAQRRQADAMKLQESAAVLEQTLAGLQQRADITRERLAVVPRGPWKVISMVACAIPDLLSETFPAPGEPTASGGGRRRKPHVRLTRTPRSP